MSGKKRYEILVEVLHGKPSPKTWALARILIDCMTLEELYEEVSGYNSGDVSYREMKSKDILHLLKIPSERVYNLNLRQKARTLKNYDIVLVNAFSGRVKEAKELMKYLRDIGPKKELSKADFVQFKEILTEFDTLKKNLKEAFKKFPRKGVKFWEEYWNNIWEGREKEK